MAVRDDFAPGEVLAAADLNDTFGAKANLASPTFTGTPAAPTAAAGTNTTQIATTAFAQAASGLRLITTQSFSAASSVSIDNCFSADYDNYRILCRMTGSTDTDVRLRLRASGSDSSASNYAFRRWAFGSSSSTSTSGSETFSPFSEAHPTNNVTVTADMFSPQAAAQTSLLSLGTPKIDTLDFCGLLFTATTSFDGFTIYPVSGTITGAVSVLGYRK